MIRGFRNLLGDKDLEIRKLYKDVPKRKYTPHLKILKPNILHQIDILFLPTDKKYDSKYLLLVVDVGNSLCDGKDMKNMDWENDILPAVRTLYDKSEVLDIPRCISGDSQFDCIHFRSWCNSNGVEFKKTQGYEHTQLAHVNQLCKTIGTILWKMQVVQEMKTKKSNTNWVENYRDVINILNEHRIKKYKINEDGVRGDIDLEKIGEVSDKPQFKTEKGYVLGIGSRVRIRLTHPRSYATDNVLNGNFRATDHRWSKQIYEIVDTILQADEPVLYQVKNATNNKIYNYLLTQEKLMVV